MFKKLDKKKLRSLAYIGIVGGCAVFALVFFTICQFQKAKYKASQTMLDSCEMSYNTLKNKDVSNLDEATKIQHDALVHYWKVTTQEFRDISYQNAGAYKGTAIPAYLFSMATLVAFGLVLKDAEKVKEKEDQEVA